MAFAQNLKKLRYQKGWGPKELADAAGISRTAIHLIESRSTSTPRAKTAKRLAVALGVEVDLLYVGTEMVFPLRADTPAQASEVVAGLKDRQS